MARILLIDDEDEVRNLVRRMLESGSHDVVAAASGEEGIEKFKQGTFDLVLCDSRMPGKHGAAVMQEIRRLSPTVILVSVSGAAADDAASAEAPADVRRIAKPFRTRELLSFIEDCLARRTR